MTKSPFNAPRSSRGARGLLCFALATSFVHAADDKPKLVQQFLGKYCLECHDADVQKGDRAFEKFALPLKSVNELIDARDIIDQLTLKEMPPKKADQPNDEERIAMIRALRDGTVAAHGKFQSTGSRTVSSAPTATPMPKIGQNRSSQTEPGSACRAITGRKVAVTM